MTDDMHQRVTDRIAELRAGAEAATPGPWEAGPRFGAQDNSVYLVREKGVLVDTVGMTKVFAGQVANTPTFRENAIHIATWNPAFVLRWLDWAQEVAERHQHTTNKLRRSAFDPDTGKRRLEMLETFCAVCGWVGDEATSLCLEKRGLAKALGIEEGG